jgi:hypothetical protein
LSTPASRWSAWSMSSIRASRSSELLDSTMIATSWTKRGGCGCAVLHTDR